MRLFGFDFFLCLTITHITITTTVVIRKATAAHTAPTTMVNFSLDAFSEFRIVGSNASLSGKAVGVEFVVNSDYYVCVQLTYSNIKSESPCATTRGETPFYLHNIEIFGLYS